MTDLQSEAARSSLLLAVPAEVAADALERTGEYRVLRRLAEFSATELNQRHVEGSTQIGCAIDVETTGLDHGQDKIIELALRRFRFDGNGRIVEVGLPRSWLEDPGHRLSTDITSITRLTDADLVGKRIDDVAATELLTSADVVIAHNATFDRPFVESRLPRVVDLPWACSCRDIDWRGHGFEGAALSQLMMQCGWFYEAHRAEVDVLALLRLLDHPLGQGKTVLQSVLEKARQGTVRIEATGAPFAVKDRLKARGYRWNTSTRLWSVDLSEEAVPDEKDWLALHVYGGLGEPHLVNIDWTRRYNAAF